MIENRFKAEATGITGIFRVKDQVTGKSVAQRATYTGAANLAAKMNQKEAQ